MAHAGRGSYHFRFPLPGPGLMATPEADRFLLDEMHRLTLQATVQRAAIYRPGIPEREHIAVRGTLRAALDDLSAVYQAPVPDERHVANIEALSGRITTAHRGVLRGSRFRIGPAQKALNLFLKYLWCLGRIPMPPHCPFDARVIALLPADVRCTWTDLDSVAAYRRLVDAGRQLAGDVPLAEWELAAYNAVSVAASRPVQDRG